MRLLPSVVSLTSLALLSAAAFAGQPTSTEHVIVAPTCLLNKTTAVHTTLAVNEGFSLISINKNNIDALVEARAKRSKAPCGGFIDVTDNWQQHSLTAGNATTFLSHYTDSPKKAENINYKVQYSAEVNTLLKNINPQDIWSNVTSLTQFQDRYANSETGVQAAVWIQTQLKDIAKANNRSDVIVYTVATGNVYKQPSVVMKIGTSNEPGIVIGAHMDTLSGRYDQKPGADDDGSGTSSVLEVARVLLSSNMHFKKPIYIIWYSAEEMGLVGSGYVVNDFKTKKIPVDAVLQMDMTGYEHKKDPTIWLITDNTNTQLTAYLETLINTYVKQPVNRTRCGYACSDHASWNHAGFSAAFPFESSFGNDDPYIHTSQDKIDALSLEHMTDFAKLGIAFAVELAEPTT